MIFLLLCIASNIVLAHIFKVFTKRGIDNLNAIVVNYFMCVAVSSVVLGHLSVPIDFYQKPWFGLAIMLALLFITGFNILALSYQKAGISLTVIIQKMSLIIPVAFAIAFFGEKLNGYQLIGILFALIAIILVNWPEKNSLDLKSSVVALPIITMLMSGVIEVLLYYSEASGKVTTDSAEFTATCFLLAGVFGTLFAVYRYFSSGVSFTLKELYGGIALGLPNYFSIYLLVFLLAKGWDGSILFPLNNIGILIAGTGLGIIIYRESINRNKVIGLILGTLAIIFIGFWGS